jgi:ABC-2 type transport system ATP-binding protein
MLVGLVRPTGGEVEVLGAATPLPPAVSRRIGAALDAPLFYRWMTGRAMLRSLLHTAGEPDRGQVDAALQRVELLEQADKRIRAYSQGMRQRLALAAALLRDPDLLVLDEPTNGLDPQGIRLIRRLIQEERERGTAILISSHQMDEIQRLCDRIVVIANGTVAASGTVGDLGFGGPGQPQTLEDWFFALHDQEATS